MRPVYTSRYGPVIRHLDHLFCLIVILQYLLLLPSLAAAFLEHYMERYIATTRLTAAEAANRRIQPILPKNTASVHLPEN